MTFERMPPVEKKGLDFFDTFPVGKYGLGITSYFRLAYTLLKNSLCFSLFAFIVAFLYRSSGELSKGSQDWMTIVSRFTLGNM